MKYLKPNAVIEPLIGNWYAWAHLVFPPTAALNIAERHLKIIRSFIQAPHIHAAAVKNPKMLGGPFMNFPVQELEMVKNLERDLLHEQGHMLELAEAIGQLNTLIKQEARGYSLTSLYDKIPSALKGRVELFYDIYNQPGYRFIEPLMYKSEYNTDKLQGVALWVTQNDERPFVLSTPRVERDDVLLLRMPFRDERLNQLARAKREGITEEDYQQLLVSLALTPVQQVLFAELFTDEVPLPYVPYTQGKARMRYFGHACILVETPEVSLLVDPLISYYGYPTDITRFSEMHLPDKVDYVLITHNHQDHVMFETLLALRHKVGTFIVPRANKGLIQDPSLKLTLQDLGFTNVLELDELETIVHGDLQVTGLPFIGEHSDLNVQTKLVYHVQVKDHTFLFCADSCNVVPEIYEQVSAIVSQVDVMFLGMECDGAPLSWVYGPLLAEPLAKDKDVSRRLAGSNFEQGRQLVETFSPQEVFVYAMGMEPWLEFISSIKYTDESNPIIQSNKLIDFCRAKGRKAERLYGEKELLYHATEETTTL
jgi:L-ascorbate metabolism protein UlaG (beta-lactamase superfamily)